MAVLLRRLLLRHRTTAFSLLRTGSISAFSVAHDSIPSPPAKALYSPRWQWNLSRGFSSASPDMDSERSFPAKESEECLPRGLEAEDIEGCDFSHWLIVVNFPKNPRPSPEEMIRSYEETCAKALNLSLEEAKKKIYATSTSNYTGFHVQVSEVESDKFNGQPGVVFVLPDSYIDKENKEYGGDKYINGVIIPRPRVSRRRIWDSLAPLARQQADRSNAPDQSATSSYAHEQQRNSPPYTHEGVRRRSTNVAPPSQHPPPPPPPQQSYYTPPNQLFQRNNYRDVPPSTKNSFHQENDSFAPNRGNYSQGVMWNYAPPPPPPPPLPPPPPPPPPPPYFNWHHHSQQAGPYPWTVNRGYPVPGHGPQPIWPGQPHPGQPSQCYMVQPYPHHPSQTQVFPGQPDPGHPSQSQVYEGQHYPGHPRQSQVYRSQPDPRQPSQSQVYEAQPYQGHSNQNQIYRSQPNPGHPSQSQVYEGQPYPAHSSQNRVYRGQPDPGHPSQSPVYEGQPYPGQTNERRGSGPNGDYQEHGSQYGPLMGYRR